MTGKFSGIPGDQIQPGVGVSHGGTVVVSCYPEMARKNPAEYFNFMSSWKQ